jgi:hypothetical protein
LEFRKKINKEIHDFKFKRFIEFVIAQVKTHQSSSENELSEDDDQESMVSDENQ